MAGKKISLEKLKKEAVIKVFNEKTQKFTNVIIPSKLTVGAANAEFEEGMAIHGPIEFKNTTAPADTSNKLYVEGDSIKFNGAAIGTSTSGGASDLGWKSSEPDSIYTTGSLGVRLGSRTAATTGSLWVGEGVNSPHTNEILTVAGGQNLNSGLDLIEEAGGASGGFGTSRAYGFRFLYDGDNNKLKIQSGVQTTVTDRATIDRTTGLLLSKRDQIYDLFWYTSSALIQFISWYDQTEQGTGIDYNGASWRQYLMAPYDGEIISVTMMSMYSSGTPPGSTSIGFWKNANPSSGAGTATATLSIDAWATRYTTDSWSGTTTFSKGDFLSISVDPTNDARYSMLQVKIRYDELT